MICLDDCFCQKLSYGAVVDNFKLHFVYDKILLPRSMLFCRTQILQTQAGARLQYNSKICVCETHRLANLPLVYATYCSIGNVRSLSDFVSP